MPVVDFGDDDDEDERPVEDPSVTYLCGDCGASRDWDFVEMRPHPANEQHKFPICTDAACSIQNTELLSDVSSEDEDDGTSPE